MIALDSSEPVYGRDFGKIVKPRSELNAELEEIVSTGFGIPCEIEIFAEILKHSRDEPKFDNLTIILEAKYMMQFQKTEFNGHFEKYGISNVKYVSKEEYSPNNGAD